MKSVLRVFLAAVLLGLVLLLLQQFSGVDQDVFLNHYWKVGLLFLLLLTLVLIAYTFYIRKRMMDAANLLEEGKVDAFRQEMKALEKIAINDQIRYTLWANQALADMQEEKYIQSIERLESIPLTNIKDERLKVTILINRLLSYVNTDQLEQASQLMEREQNLLDRYSKDPTYGGPLAQAKLLLAAKKGDLNTAKTLLAEAKKQWQGTSYEQAFIEIEQSLKDQMDR